MLDSKLDKFVDLEKGTPAFSHVSTSVFAPVSGIALTPAEFILVLKYSEAELLRNLKIFLESKGLT